MSAGYGNNNPYVLNIVPLFGVSGSASGSGSAAEGGTDSISAQTLAVNEIRTQSSGSVQFNSPVLLEVGGVIIQLQAKIAELEARIVALGG
jgi:hypothetical protein